MFKYNFLFYIKSKVYCNTCDDIYLKVKRLLFLSEIWTIITNLALQETTRVAKLAESKLRENTRKLQVPYMSTKSQKCCGMSLARANLCQKNKNDENSKISLFTYFLITRQGVELHTAEMENTAKSFLSMAKQVLQNAEQDKRSW